MLHPTIIGWITYAGIVGFKLDHALIFKKYNLSALFVSFCFTAPLSGMVLVSPDIFTRLGCEWNGEWNFIDKFISELFFSGQTYWLLLPIQFLISFYGPSKKIYILGWIIFWLGCLNFFIFPIVVFIILPLASEVFIDIICSK
jgi:hypothetical protein